MRDFFADVHSLLGELEASQWHFRPNADFVRDLGVMTRDDLRAMPRPDFLPTSSTSGATGEQLVVAKTYEDAVWYAATNLREIRWRGWDTRKSLAVITPKVETRDRSDWDLAKELVPEQGPSYFHRMDYIDVLQRWLEQKNPHYILTLPSILQALDLSKVPQFLDARTISENGATSYSSEECGVIGLRCPDNPSVWHVMENILVETDHEKNAIVSSLTNPWIRRYKIGDHLDLGVCQCGRGLQAITRIYGRTRNMLLFPDGRKKWPTMGSLEYFTRFGIRRSQMIQTALDRIEFLIISEPLGMEREKEVISFARQHLGFDFTIELKYVDSFPLGKFEEFKSLIGESELGAPNQ